MLFYYAYLLNKNQVIKYVFELRISANSRVTRFLYSYLIDESILQKRGVLSVAFRKEHSLIVKSSVRFWLKYRTVPTACKPNIRNGADESPALCVACVCSLSGAGVRPKVLTPPQRAFYSHQRPFTNEM